MTNHCVICGNQPPEPFNQYAPVCKKCIARIEQTPRPREQHEKRRTALMKSLDQIQNDVHVAVRYLKETEVFLPQTVANELIAKWYLAQEDLKRAGYSVRQLKKTCKRLA